MPLATPGYLREIANLTSGNRQMYRDACRDAADEIERLLALAKHETVCVDAAEAEVKRLQQIIDSRPAINAGLPETYITWTHGIYELEAARGLGIANG